MTGAAMWPLLESRRDAASRELRLPHRLLVFFTPNGTLADRWFPDLGATPTSSELLAPLAPFEDRLIVFDGLDAESSYHGPGDGSHWNGIGHMLTATELVELGPASFYGGGVSLDQAVAAHVGGLTRLASIELGVESAPSTIASRISYLGPAAPLPVEYQPRAAFERMFGPVPASMRARRQSVLDATMAQAARLEARLSSEDKQKLSQHRDSLRAIEHALETESRPCDASGLLKVLEQSPDAQLDLRARAALQMDLVTQAFTCDVTRVASIMWAPSGGTTVMDWLGISEAHHTLSHAPPDDIASRDALRAIGTFYSEEFARLLAKLDAVEEGDGSLLDHTLVLWCNEIADGPSHGRRRLPWVIAGGSKLGVRGGRLMGASGHHGELLGAIARRFGLDVGCFGNGAYASGAIEL